jgi:Ca2+-binding EF-hand superfamily protein
MKLGLDSSKLLADLFETASREEIRVEEYRHLLCSNSNFKPQLAFDQLDTLSSGFLTAKNLQTLLNSYQVNVEIDLLNQLIKQYDSDADGRLTYEDFKHFVIPAADYEETLNILITSPTRKLQSQDIFYLVELLNAELRFQVKLNQLRDALSCCEDFTVLRAFQTIDTNNESFVTQMSLMQFFESMGREVDRRYVSAIMRRFDQDRDGKINYSEMLEILLPVISTPQFRSPVVKQKETQRHSSTLKKSARKVRSYIQPQKLNFDGVLERSSPSMISILFRLLSLERMHMSALEEVCMHSLFTPSNLFLQISDHSSNLSFKSFSNFIFEINLQLDSKETAKLFKFLSKSSSSISQHDFESFLMPSTSSYRTTLQSRSHLLPSPRSDLYNLSLRNYFSTVFTYISALESLDFDIISLNQSEVTFELDSDKDGEVSAKDIVMYFHKHSMEISQSDAVLLTTRGFRYSNLLPV